jgi:hypothetical protein
MPLYDAYGKPITSKEPDTPTATSNQLFRRIKAALQGPAWFRRLGLLWKLSLGLLGIAGTIATLFWGWQQFRQEILVDPYISYDSSDPFNQRFAITNNAHFPFTMSDTHAL